MNLGNLLQLRSRRKELIIACDDEWLRALRKLPKGLGQGKDNRTGEPVGGVWRLQPKHANLLMFFNLERSLHVAKSRRSSYAVRSNQRARVQPSSSSRNVPTPKHSPTILCDSGTRADRVIHCCPTRYC